MTTKKTEDAYAYGFATKCAEAGIDPEELVKQAISTGALWQGLKGLGKKMPYGGDPLHALKWAPFNLKEMLKRAPQAAADTPQDLLKSWKLGLPPELSSLITAGAGAGIGGATGYGLYELLQQLQEDPSLMEQLKDRMSQMTD